MLTYEFAYLIGLFLYIFLVINFLLKKINISSTIFISIFYFYIVSVITVTLFPIPIDGLISPYPRGTNFIPLNSIYEIFSHERLPDSIKLRQIGGNILMFIPFGFLVSFSSKKKGTFLRILFLSFLFSLSIEMMQLAISYIVGFNYRVIDIDDIILNMLGGGIGYIIYTLFFLGRYILR